MQVQYEAVSKGMHIGLVLLAGVITLGRFVPGTLAWGFNQFVYLPDWMFALWIMGCGVMLWPRTAAGLERAIHALSRWLLQSRGAPFAAAVVAGAVGMAFGRSSHFLGDGTWLAANVEGGREFHFFDFVDYRLHVLAYEAWGGRMRADELYRIGSVLAGMVASAMHLLLVRRLPWEPWRRVSLYLLLFATPPVALYFGYVESYSFLYVALTAFMLAAMLVLAGRGPLWFAAALFGAGLFLHLSALFSAPALLVLGLLSPRNTRMRWASVLAPPAAFLLLAVIVYLASGYDWTHFETEFLNSTQGRSIFLPLSGERGLFSFLHWKDLINQLFLTAPVCLVVMVVHAAYLRRNWRRPELLFLLTQIGVLALIRIVIDAKLGGAKDWDLMAAHTASFPILAAILLGGSWESVQRRASSTDPRESVQRQASSTDPREKTSDVHAWAKNSDPDPITSHGRGETGAVLGLSVLIAASWVLLQSFQDRSLARLIEVTEDAPEETRTYVIEDVGRYYRERQDYPRALRIYQECARRSPRHARLRAQLGALYYATGDIRSSETELRAAVQLDPDTQLALELLAEITLATDRSRESLAIARHLADVAPEPATTWELLGRAAMAQEAWEEAARAYGEAAARRPIPENLSQHGLALLRAEHPAEAARVLRRAVASSDDIATRLALAWALVSAAERDSMQESRRAQLDEAERVLREELRSSPGDADILQLLRRVAELR